MRSSHLFSAPDVSGHDEAVPIGPAARRAGVSVTTFKRWLKIDPTLFANFRTEGGHRRFPVKKIDEWKSRPGQGATVRHDDDPEFDPVALLRGL